MNKTHECPICQAAAVAHQERYPLQVCDECAGRVRASDARRINYGFARGGSWGQSRLERALRDGGSAGLAMYALSRAPGIYPAARLEQALGEPRLRAFALRALALRQARLGEASPALQRTLPVAETSALPAERVAAAFARAILEPSALLQSLGSTDPLVVRAVARLALFGPAANAAVARLATERDPLLRVALSIGLADPEAASLLTTRSLLELMHEAGPGSLLAAAALAARKDADLLPLVRELLASGDPWLRAHTLLGLSFTAAPDALGLIENAYRFEPEASVRHAAVVALSRRSETVRKRALTLAAELDASALVRGAARLALSGHSLSVDARGPETAWLELAKTPGASVTSAPAAQVRFGSGLALPVVADPDGVAALAGVDPAVAQLRLALLAERVNLPEPRP